jgi:hypothetical protein
MRRSFAQGQSYLLSVTVEVIVAGQQVGGQRQERLLGLELELELEQQRQGFPPWLQQLLCSSS